MFLTPNTQSPRRLVFSVLVQNLDQTILKYEKLILRRLSLSSFVAINLRVKKLSLGVSQKKILFIGSRIYLIGPAAHV